MIRRLCLQIVLLYIFLLFVAVVITTNQWLVFVGLVAGWFCGVLAFYRWAAYMVHRRCTSALTKVLRSVL